MRWEGRQLVEGARRSLLSLCYKRGAVGVGVGTADTVYHIAHSTSLPLLREPQFPPGVSVLSPKTSQSVQISYDYLFPSATDWHRSRHMTPMANET